MGENSPANSAANLFDALCGATQDAVVCASLDGIVTQWSPGAERVFGYTADEMLHQPVKSIVPEDRRHELSANLKAISNGQQIKTFDTVRLHKSGQPIEVSLTVQPIHSDNGEVTGSLAVIHDETELHRTAESLRRSEQRFRSLLEGSIQGILIHRGQRPLFINQAYADIHGYSVDELMKIPSMSDLHAPNDRKRIFGYMKARMAGEEVPSRYEYQAIHKDGSLVWLENAVRVVEWDAQPAIQATIVDISERKRAEIKLRSLNEDLERRVRERTDELAQQNEQLESEIHERQRSENKLRQEQLFYSSLVDNIPLCVVRKDLDGKFTFVNKALCEVFEQPFDDIVGKDDFAFSPPDMAEKFRADDRQVAETGKMLKILERHPGHDGQDKFIQTIKNPIYDASGNVIGTQLVFTDLTDRVRAEEELKETNARRQAIFDSSLDCMIFIDAEGRIAQFNRSAQRTFGYTPHEIIGRSMDDLFAHEEADESVVIAHGRSKANIDRYAQFGELGSMLGQRTEIPLIKKDGTKFTAEMAMQPIPMKGASGFALFLRDITDRKKAEEARRSAAEEVRLKNRDLETLLYVISHDLREPLRAIENFSRIVKDRYTEEIDQRGGDFLARIYRAAQRMDRLLDDVLMLSRAQRTVAPDEKVNLAEVVEDIVRQLDVKIEETSANVVVLDGLPILCVDRRWVTQAVFNLVGNALKYVKPGELPDVEIASYHGDPSGGQSGLVVRDRGSGVPAEATERIFTLFQRAVGREIEGTGAGLAIVRQVAERHGGQAWVEPREGGGSNFYLTFGTDTAGIPVSDVSDENEESVSIFDD